jgi:hypothetical protein
MEFMKEIDKRKILGGFIEKAKKYIDYSKTLVGRNNF